MGAVASGLPVVRAVDTQAVETVLPVTCRPAVAGRTGPCSTPAPEPGQVPGAPPPPAPAPPAGPAVVPPHTHDDRYVPAAGPWPVGEHTHEGFVTAAAVEQLVASAVADALAAERQWVAAQLAGLAPAGHTHPATAVAWADVTGKPATFPVAWSDVAGKPATFAPAAHTHPVGLRRASVALGAFSTGATQTVTLTWPTAMPSAVYALDAAITSGVNISRLEITERTVLSATQARFAVRASGGTVTAGAVLAATAVAVTT